MFADWLDQHRRSVRFSIFGNHTAGCTTIWLERIISWTASSFFIPVTSFAIFDVPRIALSYYIFSP